MTASIETVRLHLRRLEAADFDRFHAIHSDPATNRFNPAGPMTSRVQAQAVFDAWCAHWDTHGYGQWAVAALEAPEHVIGFGGIALRAYLDTQRVNLGYRFDAAHWGQGYASELAFAARDVAMGLLAVPCLYGLVRPLHGASIRVLDKIGMEQVDLLDDVPGAAPSLVYAMTPARFAAVTRG
jgi:RimJ/RimL family protein N-acetyltransferase